MVRVAALKHAIDEGDASRTRPACGRGSSSSWSASARTRMGGAAGQDAHRGDPARPGRARHPLHGPLRTLKRPSARSSTVTSPPEVLPALTPLAIDVVASLPQLANLSLNLAILLAPPKGTDQPRAGRGAGPGRAAPRWCGLVGGDGNTYVLLEEVISRRAGRALPRAEHPGGRPPSASRGRGDGAGRRGRAATTWRPSRTSCASGA